MLCFELKGTTRSSYFSSRVSFLKFYFLFCFLLFLLVQFLLHCYTACRPTGATAKSRCKEFARYFFNHWFLVDRDSQKSNDNIRPVISLFLFTSTTNIEHPECCFPFHISLLSLQILLQLVCQSDWYDMLTTWNHMDRLSLIWQLKMDLHCSLLPPRLIHPTNIFSPNAQQHFLCDCRDWS